MKRHLKRGAHHLYKFTSGAPGTAEALEQPAWSLAVLLKASAHFLQLSIGKAVEKFLRLSRGGKVRGCKLRWNKSLSQPQCQQLSNSFQQLCSAKGF
jgi:hypothetical protein